MISYNRQPAIVALLKKGYSPIVFLPILMALINFQAIRNGLDLLFYLSLLVLIWFILLLNLLKEKTGILMITELILLIVGIIFLIDNLTVSVISSLVLPDNINLYTTNIYLLVIYSTISLLYLAIRKKF